MFFSEKKAYAAILVAIEDLKILRSTQDGSLAMKVALIAAIAARNNAEKRWSRGY